MAVFLQRRGAWCIVAGSAPLVDGRGGGKPGMAQAGGSKPEGADDALAAIKAAI